VAPQEKDTVFRIYIACDLKKFSVAVPRAVFEGNPQPVAVVIYWNPADILVDNSSLRHLILSVFSTRIILIKIRKKKFLFI
jgi:hypothetical protein